MSAAEPFAGVHGFTHQLGKFDVFYIADQSPAFPKGQGWYWWPVSGGSTQAAKGPFPEAQGAYLDAIGD